MLRFLKYTFLFGIAIFAMYAAIASTYITFDFRQWPVDARFFFVYYTATVSVLTGTIRLITHIAEDK